MRKVLYAILAIALVGLVISGVLAFVFWQKESIEIAMLIVLVVPILLITVFINIIQKIQKLNAMEKRLPTVKERQIKKCFLYVFAAILIGSNITAMVFLVIFWINGPFWLALSLGIVAIPFLGVFIAPTINKINEIKELNAMPQD